MTSNNEDSLFSDISTVYSFFRIYFYWGTAKLYWGSCSTVLQCAPIRTMLICSILLWILLRNH